MHEAFEEIICNLCGSTDQTVVFPSTLPQDLSLKVTTRYAPSDHTTGHDQIVRCNQCGLVFVSPRMKAQYIWQGYSDAVDEKYATQDEERIKTFQAALKQIEQYVPSKGRLLDVGSAAGFFLKVTTDAGWQAEGIEPNKGLAAWGRQRYGVTIRTEDLLTTHYPEASFDVVTFWDVLEHVSDPRAYIREAWRITKPGGFVFVNFPDFGSLLAKAAGKRWWFLSPVHIYYFDRTTLAKLLELEGYSVKRIDRHWQTLSLGYLIERFGDYSRPLASFGQKVAAAVGLSSFPLRYYASQALAVAQKSAT